MIQRKSGFTLLELLVAMAIFSIVMGMVFYFLIQTINLTTKSEIKAKEVGNAKKIMERIRLELKSVRFITEAGSEKLAFFDSEENQVVLESREGRLLKNDLNMVEGDLEAISLELRYFSRDSTLVREVGQTQGTLVEIEEVSGGRVLPENLSKINLIHIWMKFQTRQYDLSLVSSEKVKPYR